MLEDRPIVQKSLIGFGAFAFVFSAAMAGTAFMISGGFDIGGGERPQSVRAATQTAWNDWTQPAYAATPSAYEPTSVQQSAPMEAIETPVAYETPDDLAGDDRADARSEQDVLRDIERELAAYEDQSAYAPESPAYQSEDEVIEAKERAAAMEGYGPY
jgi:hypothetical protein